MLDEQEHSQILQEVDLWPFEMGYLPEDFVQKAAIYLNETEENKTETLKEMREFVESEKTMSGIEFDDNFLIQFLRYGEYDVSSAFKRLTNYVILRKDYPHMFTDLRFDVIVNAMTRDVVTYLPWRCADGCAIVYVNLENWIPSEFPVADVQHIAVVIILQGLRDPMTQVNGVKVIFNARSNPWRHLRYCTFENLYLLYHGTQNCAPLRFQSLHLVNPSVTSKFCMAMMWPFLPEELKRKILIHSSPEKLLDYFPKKVIPAIYGGDLLNYDMSDWLKKVMEPESLETMGGKFSG